jgi:hypothetical protein
MLFGVKPSKFHKYITIDSKCNCRSFSVYKYENPSSATSQESEVLSIIRYRGTWKIAGIVAQRSSRCPYTLLLIELPTPVATFNNCA